MKFSKKQGLRILILKNCPRRKRMTARKRWESRVMDWIKKNAPKAVVGGVKLGADITKEVLTAYLKQYTGIS